MAPYEALVRYKKNQVEQHLRTVKQIQKTIADFQLLSDSLDRQIKAEEDRLNVHESSHYAYSTLAKATIQRRNNLMRSIDKLKIQLDTAKKALREENDKIARLSELPDTDQVGVHLQPFNDETD